MITRDQIEETFPGSNGIIYIKDFDTEMCNGKYAMSNVQFKEDTMWNGTKAYILAEVICDEKRFNLFAIQPNTGRGTTYEDLFNDNNKIILYWFISYNVYYLGCCIYNGTDKDLYVNTFTGGGGDQMPTIPSGGSIAKAMNVQNVISPEWKVEKSQTVKFFGGAPLMLNDNNKDWSSIGLPSQYLSKLILFV